MMTNAQQRERFIRAYLKELEAGDAAVFAGAGLSAAAGFVDWRGLLRELAEELQLNVDWEVDLVALAQFHVNRAGNNRNRLNQAIIEALASDSPPTPNHRVLARLPISTWWTTNYDKLIEMALRDAGKIVDVKSDVDQLANTRPRRDAIVYKMHGDVDRPNEAVVTRDDYESYPRKRGAFTNALAGDLVSKTFLFLGFSFSDPNLAHVLTQVRLTFQQNQRRHFAIFRKRARLLDESEEAFAHEGARQLCIVEDLKRFNIEVLLVEEYSDIDAVLLEMERLYRNRTVFVSASIGDFAPWGERAVVAFMHDLGRALVKRQMRLVTGLGEGAGNALFSGAVEEVLRGGGRHIEDVILARPFPQGIADAAQRASLWSRFRIDMVKRAGIALFLFGNKMSDGGVVNADGMRTEYELAQEEGLALLPIGATGSMASTLSAIAFSRAAGHLPQLDDDEREILKVLSEPREDLHELVEPIADLVLRLRNRAVGD